MKCDKKKSFKILDIFILTFFLLKYAQIYNFKTLNINCFYKNIILYVFQIKSDKQIRKLIGKIWIDR